MDIACNIIFDKNKINAYVLTNWIIFNLNTLAIIECKLLMN